MTLLAYLIAFLAIVYIAWSILKIRRLLIENVALENEYSLAVKENGRLKKWLQRYEGTQQKVALTRPEKSMILDALEAAPYRERVQAPQTKRFIRNIYNALREKIREANKEYAG